MTPRQRGRVASLEHRIEEALRPGTFIAYGAAFAFVRALEAVEGDVAKLVGTAPGEAVTIYETFLAGCYEKANEVDDSSGNFGQLAQTLFRGWVCARRAAGADPDDTAAQLVARMENDPYGYCYGHERDVSTALDARGLTAFVRAVRSRFDVAPPPGSPTGPAHDPDRSRRRWAAVLRVLLRQLRDVRAYLALAAETETTAVDCHAVAGMLRERATPRRRSSGSSAGSRSLRRAGAIGRQRTISVSSGGISSSRWGGETTRSSRSGRSFERIRARIRTRIS